MSDVRTLKGAVTWESIAQARLLKSDAALKDCVVPAEVVGADEDLLSHIPRVVQHNYVFVRAADNTLAGILTTSDLSARFASLTGPFLLIGEIERNLREIVRSKFSVDEMREGKDERDTRRTISGPEDLTFGELHRLFEDKTRWEAHRWPFERGIFLEALQQARTVQNDVMHFSPDEIEEDRLNDCRHLLKWLRLVGR